MKIHLIAAARPNFMKIAPLYHELIKREGIDPVIVHTGQHYDLNMSDIFFRNLGLADPDIHLSVGSGTHAQQTGNVMIAYEKVLVEEKPDLVVVVGDVNSTVAATMAAVKMGIKTAHLEAGLRSFDRTMPEEINRVITDSIADILWTPSRDGNENLRREGVPEERIEFVGNIMIDSLEMFRGAVESKRVYKEYGCRSGEYGLVTLHRPANVDDREKLEKLCSKLVEVSRKIPLIFPVHPRTSSKLDQFCLNEILKNTEAIHLIDPLGYIDFMNLVFNSKLIITDSGGIQEETTYLGVPCLTIRPNTERPITITQGTNQLCTTEEVSGLVDEIISGQVTKSSIPDFWDGKTAIRVADSIERLNS